MTRGEIKRAGAGDNTAKSGDGGEIGWRFAADAQLLPLFRVQNPMRHLHLRSGLLAVWAAAALQAHDPSGVGVPAPWAEPVAAGGPGSRVTITESDGFRHITANGIPDHETGDFPNRDNPNRIREQEVRFQVPLAPRIPGAVRPVRPHLFGVALNGVKFDPGTAEFWRGLRGSEWNEEAIVDGKGKLGIDPSNAHVQPDGSYHYHGIPWGLVRRLKGENTMVLVGWAADGFPIYGPWAPRDAEDARAPLREMRPSYRLKSGSRPGGEDGPGGRYDGTYTADFEYVPGSGDLDECNGRTGVTPEFPGGTYYYVLTREFPFVPRFFRGEPDPSFRKERGGSGGGPGGSPGRRPPPGGPF